MDQQKELLRQLTALTAIPSPTGMTGDASAYLMKELVSMGFHPERTIKGTVLCNLGGNGHPVLITGHVDTLGAVVRAVKENGRLRISHIGGFSDSAILTENVLIHTRRGQTFTGTVQSVHASRHVWGKAQDEIPTDENVEVVPDEEVYSKADTEKLGIRAGDFISFDPRTVITQSGYIKSRHLDNKASAAVLLAMARDISEGRLIPGRQVTVAFTVYEEIGHGASALYHTGCEDMIAVDMGCVGDDLTCRETQVSICAKDAAGPYDFTLTNELIERCENLGIDYAVDVYPSYTSDTATALHAGMEARFACCGQGVFASHGYERTHIKGILGTLHLIEDVVRSRKPDQAKV